MLNSKVSRPYEVLKQLNIDKWLMMQLRVFLPEIFLSHQSPGFLPPSICEPCFIAPAKKPFKHLRVGEELVEIPAYTRELGPPRLFANKTS